MQKGAGEGEMTFWLYVKGYIYFFKNEKLYEATKKRRMRKDNGLNFYENGKLKIQWDMV